MESYGFLGILVVVCILPAVPNMALCPGDCLCDNTRLVVNCTDVYLPDMPITLNPHIKSMRLNYASLERIDTNMQFYPALIVCDLSHNRLTTLNPYGFEGQAQLNRLALGHNRIHTLYKESLNGLTNLQSLDLSNNKLSYLGPKVFSQLHQLSDLDLSANNIGSIHRLAFEGLSDSLLGLSLAQNRLVSVPVDSLTPLVLLQSLSLAFNSLKRLEMSATDDSVSLSSLSTLDLSSTRAERNNVCQLLNLAPKLNHLIYEGNSANQLACIENNNLQMLSLGRTDELTSLDPAVFYSMSRLKVLYVSNAPHLEVFAVDTLMANTRLEEIHITDNLRLKSISLEVFSHLPSLSHLDLSNNSLTHLKPVEGTRFAQLDVLNISENPLDCNCTVKGLIVAGLDPLKIICYTHKNDLEANFILSANSLFGDASCLTPFTIKLVFMVGLILVLGMFFIVSLTVQALYVNRKSKKEEEEQDSNSLLISLPLVSNNKSNIVPDFESPMITAWHHDLTTSRSLDQLDLKDHRDLEEFTKRYYTHGHFATLKPSIAYIGKDQDTLEHHQHHNPASASEDRCDCPASLYHARNNDLFY